MGKQTFIVRMVARSVYILLQVPSDILYQRVQQKVNVVQKLLHKLRNRGLIWVRGRGSHPFLSHKYR